MTVFQIIAIILTFAAIGGYLNHRYLKLPAAIGYMVFALLLSLLTIGLGQSGWLELGWVHHLVGRIDFTQVVLHGMLSFLLFASALHIDLNDLKDVRLTVGFLATIGVAMATVITGTLTWYAAHLIGVDLPFLYALLFGALISPTDPIAVLSILKQLGVSKKLYLKIGGESLFNDGVAIVIFASILTAIQTPGHVDASHFFTTLMHESVGGLGLGIILGWATYCLLHTIDDYKVEVLLTLALVAGGYALAEYVHMSAPLCMVAAGLIIGNHGRDYGMSDTTRNHLDMFWELVDEILNAILFLLMGLQIIGVPMNGATIALGLMAAIAVLFARLVSVALPLTAMRMIGKEFEHGTIRMMTWCGLRGGISIAMALAIPAGPEKDVILALTYIVVLFSILVQGLGFRRIMQLIVKQ